MDRIAELGEKVAERARQICPVGVDVPKGTGKWSGRRAGALRDTIRMTRLKGDPKLNIRVYAGNDTDVFMLTSSNTDGMIGKAYFARSHFYVQHSIRSKGWRSR
jgi:hypothetical protein